ncbi:MAG: hypothetical protein ACK5QT_11700 [Oligoflexia bacterium]
MAKSKTERGIDVHTAEELGEALGLTPAETAEIEFRSKLTVALSKIIQSRRMTHEQIGKRAGSSRTRVTAIAIGSTDGISTDVIQCRAQT